MKHKRGEMIKAAKMEMRAWKVSIAPGLVMAILFAFIHRLETGESVEESFFGPPLPPPEDYQI